MNIVLGFKVVAVVVMVAVEVVVKVIVTASGKSV